ncbi:MAG: hypothetical protein LBL44_07645 [Treponema sp.]|jgi:hypothetical protein|nr:hypothetical protein [Treponema sp.]
MKKFLFTMIILTGITAALPLFAQTISEGKESEYFYVHVNIEKIYAYRKGYVVLYRKGVNQMAQAYLPLEWFTEVAGKGELVSLQAPTAWPYMTVYYKSGEFDHVKLYVRKARAHETWGIVPLHVNIDDKFENITDVRLEF